MRTKLFFLLPFCLLACTQEQENSRTTIQYVKDILGDKDSYEYSLLSGLSDPDISGNICVIGSQNACDVFRDAFLARDRHDNVDGRFYCDELPDFAGETISLVVDSVDVAIFPAGTAEDSLEFRRNTVCLGLAALDRRSFLSRYDTDGMDEKNSSKIIILADSRYKGYGKFDIDTLFMASGCGVPVISPLDVMMDKVFDTPLAIVNAGIIASREEAPSGIHEDVFRSRLSLEKGQGASECHVYDCGDEEYPLSRFLDYYAADGNTAPLNCLVIDDYGIDKYALLNDYYTISSVMNEEYLTYGKYFANGFQLIFPDDTVAEKCWSMLRSDNSFTHYISKPCSEQFIARTSLADPGAVMLIRSTEVFPAIDVQN